MSKEFYMAVVTRNVEKASGKTDAAQTADVSSKTLMGAVYFQCSNISNGEYPIPARPTFGFAGSNGGGLFWVPKVGDHILVMLDTQLDQPQPFYICSVYTIPNNPIHEEWETNYPNRMGWISNIGHQFIFDDTDYDELIRIQHAFGGMIEMDSGGNYYEKVLSNRFSEVAAHSEHEVRKDLIYTVIGNHLMDIRKDYNLKVKGNNTTTIQGDYTLEVLGNFVFKQKEMIQEFGSVTEVTKGAKNVSVDGGMNETVGGCLGHAIVSNYSRTIGGNEAILVSGSTSRTFGLGYTETVALGNKDVVMLLGNYTLMITAGNIDLTTVAGTTNIGNLLGALAVDIAGAIEAGNFLGSLSIDAVGAITLSGPIGSISIDVTGAIDVSNAVGGVSIDATGAIDASNAVGGLSIDATGSIMLSNPMGEFSMDPTGTGKFGGATGYVQIDPAGNITIFGTTTTVGAGGGSVLTNLTDPVVDTITGAPHIGLPTFTAG